MRSVLIVDDEIQMTEALAESMKRCGFAPVTCHDPVDALERESLTDYSLIITDVKMPRMDGISFLEEIRRRRVFTPVIVITGYGTVDTAVKAMKLGASDFIMKPFSLDDLERVVKRLLPDEERDVVAASPEMKRILSLLAEVAKTDATVLLTGESGVGKEVLARFIHRKSQRSGGPFVAVNCAAISESLLESELFGHEKGAFTGAVSRKPGKFELAQGGTILLDEVSEMNPHLQAKLLRAIQEREIDRVGGVKPVPIDVRIVATTNRDLKEEVEKGNFREDLYYRLNVFPVRVPPLRERREDIVPLAEFFAKKVGNRMGKFFSLSSAMKEYLSSRDWPGNVRELENYIYRAAVLCRGEELEPVDVDDALSVKARCTHRVGKLKDVERELFVGALREAGGNRTKAAEILGVTVRTVRNKIKEYDIREEEYR
ncbi:MAG: sigma-54-dependent Fis family transcriptional regulator [Deltaproteobacteria bacterium]|nr:MAG: sigma-54-dependent Fis family transcriptional regulator [Deltaproteobacteria bacterium]